MRIITVKDFNHFNSLNLINRSNQVVYENMDYVRKIIDNVKKRKDRALIEYTKMYDDFDLRVDSIQVSEDEIQEAFEVVEQSYVDAIEHAIKNITKYHKLQVPENYKIEVDKGLILERKWTPIETIGLYIPGGKAPYVTACYMLGIPARIAGCSNRIACVPVDRKTGKINPYVLVSAKMSGITSIYKVGGAQAIAAMAYGTETIPKVGKIFGPGNVYVTAAKLLVYGEVDIDAPAGPSEALIIADESANEKFVAADIAGQAEHDENSAVILLTTSELYAKKVKTELDKQINNLNRRETINKSLNKYGAIVICNDIDLCIEIANQYAPEHIQIMTNNSELDANRIVNAGSVCVGEYSSIAVGDYISGVNNVIPTGGAAKYFSAVHVEKYMRSYEVQKISKEALLTIRNDLRTICNVEGFDAHLNTIEIRLKED